MDVSPERVPGEGNCRNRILLCMKKVVMIKLHLENITAVHLPLKVSYLMLSMKQTKKNMLFL